MQTLQKIVKLFIRGHITKRFLLSCYIDRILCVRFDSKINRLHKNAYVSSH